MLNCWEFKKCGREPKGEKAHELGICPAALFDESDGFCDGKNGGRACMYIAGTFCSETTPGTHREDSKDCECCDFYRMLKQEHGPEMSVFSFQKYVKEINKNLIGITEHEFNKVSSLIRKGNLTEADNPFQENNLDDIWLRLLSLVDYFNHAVKQGEWYPEDVEQFYRLKDAVMKQLYCHTPPGAKVNLKKVSYMKNSNNKENEVINPMRQNYFPAYSDYSPEGEQTAVNTNVQEMILIEMEVAHAGLMYCFHIPIEKAKDWGLDEPTVLQRKF
jgi:hypothetical protein